jgi:hypothetical protein
VHKCTGSADYQFSCAPFVRVHYSLHQSCPTTRVTKLATFADETVILSHVDPVSASRNLQTHLRNLQTWFRKWKLKVNEAKSVQVTFTLKRDVCSPVTLNGVTISQADDTKYLGMHLDKRLTWRKHIFTKRKQLGLKFSKCTDSLVWHCTTNYYYTKLYWNLSGPTEYHYEEQPATLTSTYYNGSWRQCYGS